MRQSLFQAYFEKSYATSKENAHFVSFINNHIAPIVQFIYLGNVGIIQCVAIILFSAFALIYLHWSFAAIILAISALITVLPGILQKKAQSANTRFVFALAAFNHQMLSFIEGLGVIRRNGFFEGANVRLKKINQDVSSNERYLVKLYTLVESTGGILHLMQDVLVITVGIVLVSRGDTGIGELIAALQISNVVSAPMEAIAQLMHGKNERKPLLEEYAGLLSLNKNRRKNATGVFCPSSFATLEAINLSYCFEGERVFHQVNASFDRGGKYLIVGESGCGKSVLLRMLANEMRPTAGEVLLNKQRIGDIDQTAVTATVSLIPQEPHLFHLSLKENILLDRHLPEDAYQDIIRQMNLTELDARFCNDSFDQSSIDELSGGEKQRICLARALVSPAQVYLLDESTASLDKENEDLIIRFFLNLDQTVVVVSHRPRDEWSYLWTGIFTFQDGSLLKR